MYCSKCGESNENTAKFCIKCGAQLLVVSRPEANLPVPAPLSGAQRGQVLPGQKTSTGSWLSLGSAIVILLLFFAPWASCGGEDISGLNLVADTDGELAWVAAVPFCAAAALGILYVFRRQLVVSAWARIAAAIGGLIPMIKLYADYQDAVTIKWGSVGTVVALVALILGSVQDLIAGSRQERT